MIKPHVLKNLQEINTLKLKREQVEKEALKMWVESGGWNSKIGTLHGKLNTLNHRITYLFNLKGVSKALWGESRETAQAIIHWGVDANWNYADELTKAIEKMKTKI